MQDLQTGKYSAFFEAAFKSSPNALVISKVEDGTILEANDAFFSLFEASREEVIGRSSLLLNMFANPASRGFMVAEIQKSGMLSNYETVIKSKTGKSHSVLISSEKLMIDGNHTMLTTIQDITSRKETESEIKQKNEELTRFIYTVSHDLKGPLVTIKSFTEYLREDIEINDKPAQDKDIGFIQNAADKMGVMLDELLNLSRIGRKEDPKTEFMLHDVIQNALDLVAGSITKRKVQIEITGPNALIFGHYQRLLQVYQNLIDNAVKFMGNQEEPYIELGAKIEENRNEVILFIKDNGSGIDPRYRHKVFGLFEKLETGTEGSGIGLAMVKRIVEVHGGTIWFESEGTGKGTTFYLTLDRTRIIN